MQQAKNFSIKTFGASKTPPKVLDVGPFPFFFFKEKGPRTPFLRTMFLRLLNLFKVASFEQGRGGSETVWLTAA